MTRMLVPRVRDRKGMGSDLHGCTGATMEDGTVYRANRAGVMNVENPAHVRAMLKDPNVAGDIVQEGFTIRGGRPAVQCSSCAFSAWAWSRVCPRCGTVLRVDDGPVQEGDVHV